MFTVLFFIRTVGARWFVFQQLFMSCIFVPEGGSINTGAHATSHTGFDRTIKYTVLVTVSFKQTYREI